MNEKIEIYILNVKFKSTKPNRMSGRRNHIRTRHTINVLSLVQTPIQSRSSINRLRVTNQNRNIRGRFIRTTRLRNLFTPPSSPVLTPINPVRLILRFNNRTYLSIGFLKIHACHFRGNYFQDHITSFL